MCNQKNTRLKYVNNPPYRHRRPTANPIGAVIKMQKKSLTLSLPIFWKICSLSATFILTARGIVKSQAYKFSKIYFFFYLFFQLRLINIQNLKHQSLYYFEHYTMSINKGTKIRFGEGVKVADRRRWQSAMTSPIGDVGSERVKL